MASYTVSTSRGVKSVESHLSDAQAIELLGSVEGNFARDLVAQSARWLSPKQWAWVHVLAMEEHERRRRESASMEPLVNDERQMDGVIDMFSHAGGRLKRPQVELASADGRRYRLKLATEKARHPGSVYVATSGGQYLGRITPDGLWLPSRDLGEHAGLVDLLFAFAQNPAEVARQYGMLTGQCCFCRLGLTDPRSLEVGYGPICAANYGLDWGSKVRGEPADQAEPLPQVA